MNPETEVGCITTYLKSIGIKWKLYSFANEPKYARDWGSKGLMLDSGAFTAYTKGKPIDLDALCEYIEEVKPQWAIQLDVIGDDEATLKNWDLMTSRGIPTIPVIHAGAPWEHVVKVYERSDYVMVGGLVGDGRLGKEGIAYLDYLFSKSETYEKRVHCLGVMSRTILLKYPFFSADASSPTQVFRYPGSTPLERFRQAKRKRSENLEPAIRKALALEKEVTKIWAARGFHWNETDDEPAL